MNPFLKGRGIEPVITSLGESPRKDDLREAAKAEKKAGKNPIVAGLMPRTRAVVEQAVMEQAVIEQAVMEQAIIVPVERMRRVHESPLCRELNCMYRMHCPDLFDIDGFIGSWICCQDNEWSNI
jgi:hypothetical protein